jgi:sugar lactone lactonase YvrE
MTAGPTAELVLDARAELGEGVNWDAAKGVLYWVDILHHEVHIFDPASGADRCIRVGQYVGAAVPTSAGDLMLALHHGFARLDPDTGTLTPVCDPESHLPDNRFNDGKCDPAGRFWAGTMHMEAQGRTGALYRMDKDLSVHKILDEVSISNGLAWSPDLSTLYYIDTLQYEVAAFDYDLDTGDVGRRRAVIKFSHDAGHPDGMTIDEQGMLWVAYCGGGRVARWDPVQGELLEEIRLPVTMTTNCVFGGPELDTLYISTARVTLTDEDLARQPHAGALFCVKPGVRGQAAPPFGG